MADLAALESALVKADAAGNTGDAKALAGEILRLRGQAQPARAEPGIKELLADRPTEAKRGGMGMTPAAQRGFMDPVTGGAQLLTHMLPNSVVNAGNKLNNYIAEKTGIFEPIPAEGFDAKIRADEKAYQDTRGADAGTIDPQRMAGSALNPISLLAATKLPVGATALGRIAQGAGIGAGAGALQPVTEGDSYAAEKATQTGLGAAVGGAIPAGVEAVKGVGRMVKPFIEPLTENGRAEILKRFQTDKLLGGDDSAKAKVIAALQGAKPIVPGSNPTAGEAIAEIPEATGLAAHQKIIAKTPGVSPQFATREAEQEAARKAAIQTVGKTPADLASAEGQRASDAAVNYGKAYGKQINADADLKALSDNPYFQDALPDAMKLAKANGIDPKQNLTQTLHYVKLSLDKMLARNGDTALASTEKQAVQSLQKDLVGWMGKANPEYEAARSAFSTASKPINEMQVGQYLEGKLTNPLETGERASVFANAVKDAPGTIKRATGAPRFDDLGQVLSPQNKTVVDAIMEDLQRKAAFTRNASQTNLPGGSKLHEAGDVRLPSMLSRPAMVANFVMKRIGEGADAKINELATKQYLNPQLLADALKDVPKNQQGAVVSAILQRLVTGAGTSAAAGQGEQ